MPCQSKMVLSSSKEDFSTKKETSTEKEASLGRLKIQCEEKGLSFEYPKEKDTDYDAIVNGHKVHHRYVSSLEDMSNPRIRKYEIMPNGKRKGKRYTQNDDIGFLILEVMSDQNNFYFLPKAKLIEEGVFHFY